MDLHGWIAVATLAGAVTLFVTRWIPMEATALAIPVVLTATGALTPPEAALAGFGNLAVIALGAMFVVGAGLKESGVAAIVSRGFERLAGRSTTRAVLVVMIPAVLLSAFVANAAAVAVLLPAVAALSRRTGVPASRLMMPLGYAAILGGILTLVGTTPNLIADGELRARTGAGLGVFEFARVGLPVAVLGVLYVALFGWRLLPNRSKEQEAPEAKLPEDLGRDYGFHETLWRLRVVPASKVAGKSLAQSEIGSRFGLEVVQVLRTSGLAPRYLLPEADLLLQVGDHLFVSGDAEDVWRLSEEELLQVGLEDSQAMDDLLLRGVSLAEVTLHPHSLAFGSTLKRLQFRTVFGLNVVSLWRRGTTVTRGLADLPLEMGDALLVAGPPVRIAALAKDPGFVVIGEHVAPPDVRRAPLAALILAAALLPPILGWLPLAVSAIGAALLMVATGCVSRRGARRSIDWRILFLLVGTLPLGAALEQQGVAQTLAEGIIGAGEALGVPAMLAALFLLSAAISTFVNSGAAVIILAPVAFEAARHGGLDVHRLFLAVCFGASCVFTFPFGNQVNLLVMGPGGYRERDYLRLGFGLFVLMAGSTVLFLSL